MRITTSTVALALALGCGAWAQDRPAVAGNASQDGGKPTTAVPQ